MKWLRSLWPRAKPNLDDYENRLLKNVEEYGWQCLSVFDEEGGRPDFSYSIGFPATLDAPEFIIFGLKSDVAHDILWSVFNILKEGREPSDMDRWSDLVVGYDCILREVDPSNIVADYFNSAIWYHGPPEQNGALQAMQIVWPDKDGLFPWEAGCAQWVCEDQPPLYLPRANFH